MLKKVIVKYAYFTIILLLPYALIIFPFKSVDIFTIFAEIPRDFFKVYMTFSGYMIYFILFSSVSFFIAYLLYKIYKENPNRLYSILSIALFFFILSLSFGGAMRIFFYLLCGFFTLCPLYFFGISFYNRKFVDKEHEVADDNTHNSQSDE